MKKGVQQILLIVLIVIIAVAAYYFLVKPQLSPSSSFKKTAGDYIDPALANVLSNPGTRLEAIGEIKEISWRDANGNHKIAQRDFRIITNQPITGRIVGSGGIGATASVSCTGSCTGNNCYPIGCTPVTYGCSGCTCGGGNTCSACTCSKTVTSTGVQ